MKSVADQKQTKRFKHFQMWLKLCTSLLVNSNEIIGKLKTMKNNRNIEEVQNYT